MNYTLLDLENVLRRMGRGTVWYAVDGAGDPVRWGAAGELNLNHLGDTEGDIAFEPNGEVATLTTPELSGGAILEATHLGENPQLQIPLFLADPDLLPIVSPVGQAGAGYGRVRDVSERTVVVFPEELFLEADGTYAVLAYSGGTWTVGGDALSAAQQTSLENSLWIWRGYFERPSRSFMGGHGDDGKNIVTVNFNAMMHPDLPEGQRLFSIGDPSAVGIDIETGVS